MLMIDGSIPESKTYTFRVWFEFKNFSEAEKARKRLGKLSECIRITSPRPSFNRSFEIRREERLKNILSMMSPGITYTPGKLYHKIGNNKGYKTFQRDISILIIQGKIKIKKKNNNNIKLWRKE